MTITISKKHFAARGGYVYTTGAGGFLTRQLFDRNGNALTAATEAELRKVARAWLRRQAAAEAAP